MEGVVLEGREDMDLVLDGNQNALGRGGPSEAEYGPSHVLRQLDDIDDLQRLYLADVDHAREESSHQSPIGTRKAVRRSCERNISDFRVFLECNGACSHFVGGEKRIVNRSRGEGGLGRIVNPVLRLAVFVRRKENRSFSSLPHQCEELVAPTARVRMLSKLSSHSALPHSEFGCNSFCVAIGQA